VPEASRNPAEPVSGRKPGEQGSRVGRETGQLAEGEERNLADSEHKRIDFEAAMDCQTDVAEGISLGLTRTNVSSQRFDGWVQLAPEGRFLWIREQSILKPLGLRREEDGARFELVITRVTHDSVKGYVLLPGPQGGAPGEPALVPGSQGS